MADDAIVDYVNALKKELAALRRENQEARKLIERAADEFKRNLYLAYGSMPLPPMAAQLIMDCKSEGKL